MNKIDWFYLRRPLILLLISLILSALVAAAGFQYESSKQEEYDTALATLRSTHQLYNNMVNDIDLLEQYRSLYSDYKASGLVGAERRLSWIESLDATNQVLRLPALQYSLKPQEGFDRPKFKQKRGVEVMSSPMELRMGLLHEEDLYALLEGLRLSIRNLFTVDSCTISRQRSASEHR